MKKTIYKQLLQGEIIHGYKYGLGLWIIDSCYLYISAGL